MVKRKEAVFFDYQYIIYNLMEQIKNDIEVLEPLYINDSFKERIEKIVGKKIFRHNRTGGVRMYTTEDDKSYLSLTTMLNKTMPPPKALTTWRDKKLEELGTIERVDEFVEMTADYGTYLHIVVSEFVRNQFIDWGTFDRDAISYFLNVGFSGDVIMAAVQEVKKDFASILQFFYDYDVKVLAVELPVYSDTYGVATCIDLVVDKLVHPIICDTETERNDRLMFASREKALGNLKSGKKGFFDTHVFQLAGEMLLFNETFGMKIPISNVFNIAPNNWRHTPTYKFKNQTKAMDVAVQQFKNFQITGKLMGIFEENTQKMIAFEGLTKIGQSPSDAINLRSVFNYLSNEK